MLKDFHVCFLTLVASSGFALALLGAVATLWSNTPTQEGLESFAFCLAVVFATVLANLFLFGSHLLIRNQGANTRSNKITSALSIIIFLFGVVTAFALFTGGLNSWFDKAPTMPAPLIISLRILLLLPLAWFLILLIASVFFKKSDHK